MCSERTLGWTAIVLGIVLLIAVIAGNVLFFSEPGELFDDAYAPLVPLDELAGRSDSVIGSWKEEWQRAGGFNATQLPVTHLAAAVTSIQVQMQLNNIARFAVLFISLALFAQAAMLILWGLQKFSRR